MLIILLIAAIIFPFPPAGLFFFFNQLPTFLLGYTLFLVLNKTDILSLAMVLLAIIAVISGHHNIGYLAVCSVVCILIVADKIKPLNNNFFSRLGDYSYSMYLIHVPVGIYLLGFIKNYKVVQVNVWLNIIADLSLLSLIIFISRFTFKYIELRSIQTGKRIAK